MLSINKLAKTAALASLIAIAVPKETKAEPLFNPSFSVRAGYQIPSEMVAEDFSSGLSAAGEARLSKPWLSLDLGISFYNSPGDHFSVTERGFFRDRHSSDLELSDEISFNQGATFYLRSDHNTPTIFFGGGLKQSIFEDVEISSSSGYRESSSSSERDVRDIATGYYWKFGFDFPFDYTAQKNKKSKIARFLDLSASVYFQLEFRKLSKDFDDFERNYQGYSTSVGFNLPLK